MYTYQTQTVRISRRIMFLGAILALVSVLAPALPPARPASAALSFPDPAMQTVWQRTDKPVQDGVTARSWTWGPDTFLSGYEPYLEGPGGQHLVAYFDKSRMEINNPAGDRNNPFFVTNGLLVVEMMSGRIQSGNSSFRQVAPANAPVAGDAAGSNAPTYSSLAAYASLNGDNRAPDRVGQPIQEGLGRTGGVGAVPNLAGYAKYGAYESTLGHNVPDVFRDFMNQQGSVYVNGQYIQGTVVDWVFAMGYPITEPYWMSIQVGAEQRWVLVQAFQRRILTYSPLNPDGFKVEMGNVGRSYYDWRYNQPQATPTPVPLPPPPPPPPPGQASITLNPTQGDGNTTITVNGVNFPPNTAAQLRAERLAAGYAADVGSVATGPEGKFSATIRLPAPATRFNSITITALVNTAQGVVRASSDFGLSFNPTIDVTPNTYIVNGSAMTVKGSGFPSNAGVQVGIQFDGASGPEIVANARTDGNGAFQTGFNIGGRAAGSTFFVYAVADGGAKATYGNGQRVAVINQPGLQVSPNAGPAGVHVNLIGVRWPAGQQVTIGYKAAGFGSEAFLPYTIPADGAGNFNVQVYVGPEFAGKGQVIFSAIEVRSGVKVEAAYAVTQSPPPPPPPPTPAPPPSPPAPGTLEYGLNMSVQTYSGGGQSYVKLVGSGWAPGLNLAISVISTRGDVNYGVATASVGANGAWQATFPNNGPWLGRNDVGVRVSDSANRYFSGRRLIVTNAVDTGAGTFTISGANWGPGTQVDATFQVNGEDGAILGRAGVDPNGNYAIAIVLPRADGERQVAVRSHGSPFQYEAVLGVSGTQLGAPPVGNSRVIPQASQVPEAGMPKTGGGTTDSVNVTLLVLVLVLLTCGFALRRFCGNAGFSRFRGSYKS